MTQGSRSLSPEVAMRGGSPGRARGAPQLMVRPAPGHMSPATAGRPSAARKSPSVRLLGVCTVGQSQGVPSAPWLNS